MSIFGSILDKIFHHPQAQASQAGGASPASGSAPGAQQQSAAGASPQQGSNAGAAPQQSAGSQQQGAASQQQASAGAAGSAQSQPPGAARPSMPAQSVDVEAVLNGMAAKNAQQLNWRTSIVDLMKLLGLDSSLQARKTLATELHYTGDMNDSAALNIWLHKAVMQKLADNGGKVPADLIRH
jgi:hypothetical protein